MRYSFQQLAGSSPVFLLELEFMGKRFFLSSKPVTIDGILYTGGVGEFDFTESSDLLGTNIEANTISVEVFFPGLDLVEEYRQGRTLEGSKATFSYMLEKNGELQGTAEDVVVLLDGIVQLPVIGDPLEPPGKCSFSIERQPYEITTEIISPSQVIDKTTFPNHHQDTAGGKLYPTILGAPGLSIDDTGNVVNLFCTPAYNVKQYAILDTTSFFIIAGHEVEATTVKIRDAANNEASLTVLKGFDTLGQVYSYVNLAGSGLMYPFESSIATNAQTPKEFWVSWNNGGGFLNPYGDGVLTGGADICRWALSRSGVPVDYGAWANIAGILNMYKFAGYINEPVSAWEWLKNNIIPYLPIEVVTGSKGIKPVLAQLYTNMHVEPITSIKAGIGFFRVSPLETITETGELVNSLQILYGKQGLENKYSMSVLVAPEVKREGDATRSNLYSAISKNRYGTQESTMETDYIYSRNTASRVAAHIIKGKSFPFRKISYESSIEYGALLVGDVISLVDESLFLEDSICTVIAKTWNQTGWIIDLALLDNPILQTRYVKV